MLKRIIHAALIAVALPVLHASAQIIPNPSFEANSFTVNPGYVSGNSSITGWTVSSMTNVGLNPASGSPFANNGATPNGANVAFIQSNGNVLNTLSNNITGLIVGNRYRVTFRANSRDGFGLTTNSTWSVNGGAFVRYTSSPPVQAAGFFTSPYRTNSALFTATATTAPLVIANRSTNDSAVLVDHFTIVDLLQVTNTASGGTGSLVDAISIAASIGGTPTITFATNLSGATITLTNEIVLTNSLIITATNLPAGITINGGAGANRIFSLDESANVQMIGLTLTGGDGGGTANPNYGGAIYNAGTLVLSGCTLYSNRAEYGGAIMHFGTMLAMTNCTLSGNTATGGVASAVLFQLGDGFMTHCTVTANSAENQGFAVANNSVLTLANSIIADNAGGDVSNQGTLTRVGANIVSSFGNVGSVSGPAFLTDGPHLAPLGNYGGPTRTAPPLAGSPATDAAVGSTTTSDQRGRTRPSDGNADGSAVADLGAVEQQVAAIVVTNGTDTGNGTLRAAFAVAATNGPTIDVTYIRFTNTLSGATIVLTNEIVVTATGVVVDASNLPQPVTIDGGPGSNRIFFVNSGRSLSLLHLTLTGGGGAGASLGGNGGAICVVGFLHLADCTLSGNDSALMGGAIKVYGRLNMAHCTISENNADSIGGAIHATSASAAMTLWNCTISENNAGLGGGVWIQDSAQMTLTHCTVSRNAALTAGGIAVAAGAGTVVLANSIVAGNTAGFGPDFYNDGTLTRLGTNIVQTAIANGGPVTGSGTILAVNPLLGSLTNNGGRTKTMALLPGSPALDRAGGSTLTVDQRGFRRGRDGDGNGSKISDIGAFEAQTPPANGPEGHLVDTVADELDPEGVLGTGMSLREAVRDVLPSGNIFFDTTLFNGQVADRIVLSNALNLIALVTNETINATNVTGGVTIDAGPGTIRHFYVDTNANVRLLGLTLVGGNGNGTPLLNVRGGSIYNNGILAMIDCNVISNQTIEGFGGGILNNRTLTLSRCTIAFNSSKLSGGGVNNFSANSILFATNCTFFGNNSTTNSGGGLANVNNATATVTHCTFTENLATNTGSAGGGIHNGVGVLQLVNSIVTSNRAAANANTDGTMTPSGANITSGNALLGRFGNYGGLTPTVPLLAGSPATNTSVGSTQASDQRGVTRLGNADLGAYERRLGVVTNITIPEDIPGTNHFAAAEVGVFGATSSIPGLVQSFAFSNVGTNYALTITPALNTNGAATITVTNSVTLETATFQLTVTAVNDAPGFTKGADQLAGNTARTIPGWATAISPGPPNESAQTVSFITSNNSNSLFSVQPAVAPNGTLTFTPAGITSAVVTVSVYAQDNGSGTPPNVNTSAVQTFTITFVTPDSLLVVTNANDAGPGSLRGAIANARLFSGPDVIQLDPGLSGSNIVLSSQIVIDNDVTISATNLPARLTISGNGGTRLFFVSNGVSSVMQALTLHGGYVLNGNGGAILNEGNLTLNQCTLFGNTAENNVNMANVSGGAVFNSGTLVLTQSTLYQNSVINPMFQVEANGGAIFNSGNLTIARSTLYDNSVSTFDESGDSRGGAIRNQGTMDIQHSTIVNNSANGFATTAGGGIFTAGSATLNNTLVAGNLPDNVSGTYLGSNNLFTGIPQLAPPGNYGGPTRTMALLAGSPALNAAVGSPATSDQRGFPILGVPDIGAYERQLGVITNITIAEDIPGTNHFAAGAVGVFNAASSVPGLVQSFAFSNVGTNYALTITPAPNSNGTATITVTNSVTSESATFQLTVTAVNDAPSFTTGADQIVGNAARTIPGWATAISPGPPNESAQTVSFIVSNNSNALFSVQPAVAPNGTLTFTPAGITSAVVTVSVYAQDNGSGTPPNVNTSAVQTFTITLIPLTPEILAVTNANDAGPGSLRQAVTNAALFSGPDVLTLAASLSGTNIVLGSPIVIDDGVTIAATNLPGGLTISGGGVTRIFTIGSGTTNVLRNLTLTGGFLDGGSGGAIHNSGDLAIIGCTLNANYVRPIPNGGGAIFNVGRLTISHSTLQGNTADQDGIGGAIWNAGGDLVVTHCTISGNYEDFGFGGGGIHISGGSVTLSNTIVANNSYGNMYGSFTNAGNNILSGDPMLAPLGNYGGPTPTMPPLIGSSAIDTGGDSSTNTFTTDQRGLPRFSGSQVDIGAVEFQVSTVVSNTSNAGEYSLRAAATYSPSGSTITFAPHLAGQTIVLDTDIGLNRNLTITATNLPGGVQITRNSEGHAISTFSGTTNTLQGLTIRNSGIAIFNAGSMSLADCTIADNSTGSSGGGIFNDGPMTLLRCTLYGNSAVSGGAIYNYAAGVLALYQCTLSGNSAQYGGGLYSRGSVTMQHTTISGNAATNGGGGIYIEEGTLILSNTIVAGNTAASDPNLYGTFTGANIITSGNPLLDPLDNYGGRTKTMRPQFGSPAIDNGDDSTTNSFATDQRGLPRFSGSHVDIGAVEFQVGTVVSNTSNAGEYSLRAAATYSPPGSTVTFANALSGQTITLASQIALAQNLEIDGSSLPAGVTISGNNATRIFQVASGQNIMLRNLTLTGGNGSGNEGGAIYSSGNLTLSRCTLHGNSATRGGAIYHFNNLTLDQCTVQGNTASQRGNSIHNQNGTLVVRQSTVSGNSGGIDAAIFNSLNVTVDRSIVAGNTPKDLYNWNISGFSPVTYTRLGTNIVETLIEQGPITTNGPDPIAVNPLLAPLGNYGGPTPTMALLPGSPARNAAAGSSATSDQRGFPIVGIPDIGAYEAGTFSNFDAWIWETLLPTNANHAAGADPDGDGVTNDDEWDALTNPGDGNNFFEATGVARSLSNSLISFPSVSNRQYTLESAGSVFGPWNDSGLPAIPGDGTVKTFTLTPDLATQKYFRVEVGP